MLAINTAVNTLSHMVNLTARVSESQKGQRKLTSGTHGDFSEMYRVNIVLDVLSSQGWTLFQVSGVVITRNSFQCQTFCCQRFPRLF